MDLNGRLSNPAQRRLSPTAIVDLVEAYQAGATISQLAVEFGIHRTTVTGHLDRHGVPRHCEHTAWDDEILKQAAELYATGSSLADVADQFGIDAQTVANRFRRAGVAVRVALFCRVVPRHDRGEGSEMTWLGIAIAAAFLVIAIGGLARWRAREDRNAANVDPLFTIGIAITGAGVALATTLGSVMYAVMAAGLIVMATGTYRTRHHRNG